MSTQSQSAREIEEQPAGPAAPRLSRGARFLLLGLVLCGAVVLALFIHTGIDARVRADAALRRQTSDMAITSVSVIRPKTQNAVEEIVLPGNMQAFVATPIYARTSGYLKTWYFDIGARVKAGQLLAEIETPEIDRQIDQARAGLAKAQADYSLAQSTAARYESLLKSESVSRQETEEKLGDLQAKQATMDSARFNIRRLEELQRFQKIYAPFDGVITARNTDMGALIDAGANAPGKQLFDIAATNKLRVYVSVPQAYSRAARPGSPAYLTLEEFPGRRFAGRLVRTADAIDPASRTLLTEVDVDNAGGELLPGAFVSVHLKLPSKVAAVVLPINALLFRSEGLRVAVVRDSKAVLVPIQIGRDFGNEVEVVDGVRSGDLVVVNPPDSLLSGTHVRIVEDHSGGQEAE